MGKQPAKDKNLANDHIKFVKDYYDKKTLAFIENLGTSFQAGLLRTGKKISSQVSNFYFLVKQAGIKPGDQVLDAGCGVCGPSIDIARLLNDLHIEAITISLSQACIASQRIKEHELTDRIHVNCGDFHYLPFPDQYFDVVFFLESACHSNNLDQLFSSVHRVLRPGGLLYIKDIFVKDNNLSQDNNKYLKELIDNFTTCYVTMGETLKAIQKSELDIVIGHDISELISFENFNNAIYEERNSHKLLTNLAKAHIDLSHMRENLPIYGEIIAKRLI